jgi:anthranilate/para-aminobenzoate synthase component I
MNIPDYDYSLASVSPELLLSMNGNELSTRPIKGTRPRARSRGRDLALKRELAASRKEVSEHMMLVDLERNDLGKVCAVGSVRWHDWRIESHPTVHHLVSDVRGRLRDDLDGWDALQALFPGGSITGCPKTATIAAIDELEAGGVVINDMPTLRFDIQPYGGIKLSGVGREGPRFAIEEMSEIKSIVIC